MPQSHNRAALLWRCPQSANMAAKLSAFFAEHEVPVNEFVQYSDVDEVFLRLEWHRNTVWADEAECVSAIVDEFGEANFEHHYSVRFIDQAPTVGLMCSVAHVLIDVLKRIDTEYYPTLTVPFVISDQEPVGKVADHFGVPFFYISPTLSVEEIQRRQMEIIERYTPDFLGLARYDALLSQPVIDHARCPVLTVHNSFLPSIKSEKAYSLAYEQGVKLVGATSRLMQTKALGPIVAQDVVATGPGVSAIDFGLMGQRVERKVFATALRKLVEHKVIVYNAKTIVFD